MKIPADLDPKPPPLEEFRPRTPAPPPEEFLDPPMISMYGVCDTDIANRPYIYHEIINTRKKVSSPINKSEHCSLVASVLLNEHCFTDRLAHEQTCVTTKVDLTAYIVKLRRST